MLTKDYYRIMALSPDASEEEIKRAHRKLAMEYHPDRNRDDSNSARNDMERVPFFGRVTFDHGFCQGHSSGQSHCGV